MRTCTASVRVLLGTTVLIAMVSLGGCSSGAPAASGQGPGTPAAGNAIPVGVIGSYTSGALATLESGTRETSVAWADAVNAAGGIDGRPIHLYIEDDQANAAQALQAAKTLIEQDHVVAIVGEASQSAAPWAAYVQSTGVPVVGGSTFDAQDLSNPDFFGVGGNLASTFYGITALAKQAGRKFGDLYCAETPACAVNTALIKSFGAELGGPELAYSSPVSTTAPDFTAQCQGLRDSGVNSYSIGTVTEVIRKTAAECLQQGLSVPLILADVVDANAVQDPAFTDTEVVSTLVPYFDTTLPAMRAFRAALSKYAPSVGGSAAPLSNSILQVWVSGVLFEAAVKAAGHGPVTAASVKQGLYSLKGDTLNGLTVPLSFESGKVSLHNCYFTYSIRNGKAQETGGVKPTCAPDSAMAGVLPGLTSGQ